ncbi:hypothetical protein BST22_15870 [Mycolicibacterium chubuense]|uniref:Uncharacterized protein n=1 Tax=Mycolicibacterium chubuense TaxID=1800 RepID=A0A0J6Z435_MYCCU|nr:hypothetical protein [Mycolicibacterium chubuense]KMO79391.1 hypothetical protein MCHUDSM44219_02933 [Mycolicibacterium chubuense]ORA50676.1 hypothetical protein BST22_15870 [Mycolicibacterium chubuense]SPX99430.1 Uncharacterised protein [Mycolicibacterium chubuense]
MSRRSEQKKARRKKRRAVRDDAWVPARVAEQLEIAAELEDFDARLTERGWEFSEDVDDETGAAWYWPASEAEVADEDEVVNVTVVLLTPEDEGEVAHVVFVGTADDYQFNLSELFEHLDTIEAYRLGDPMPVFA